MTIHYPAGSWETALLETLRHLTDAEIEHWTGKSRSTFDKVRSPANRMGLHLADAARLDAALISKGQAPKFGPLMQEMTAAFASPQPQRVDIARQLRRLGVEVGELNKAVDDGLADGRLSTTERRTIAREAQDVIDHAAAVRDAAEPPHFSVVQA